MGREKQSDERKALHPWNGDPMQPLTYLSLVIFGALTFFAGPIAMAQDNYEPLPIIDLGSAPDIYAERLSAVENYLNNIRSLSAEFIQQAPDGGFSRGSFNLERPGRVRFEYEEGNPILIVGNGGTLNLIDYEIGEIIRWPIEDTPLALLLAEDIRIGDNISLVTSGPGALANMIAITAKDPKHPEQGTLTLIFSTDRDDTGALRLSLRNWQIIDVQGAITTVTLIDLELNPELDPALWEYEDPRGARFQQRRRRR